MKKEWKDPTISSTGVKQTKEGEEDVTCEYQSDAGIAPACIEDIWKNRCCPCKFYNRCKKSWKYKGPCAS